MLTVPFGLDGYGRTVRAIKSPTSTDVTVTITGIVQGLRPSSQDIELPAGVAEGETTLPFVRVDSVIAKQAGSSATYYIGFGWGSWAYSGYWNQNSPTIGNPNAVFSIWADGSSVTTETMVNRAQGTFKFPDYAWPVAGDDRPVIYQWAIVD